jgi:peptidoglycan DL-endopeptidase CwlO
MWRLAASALLVAGLAGCDPEPALAPGVLLRAGRAEPPATPIARSVLGFAEAQLGRPYCWGGTGPRCFDCSGFVQRAWGSVGVRLPRTADAIARGVPPVAVDDVRAGDILWWPGHVALYEGSGWTVEALDRRSGVIRRRAETPVRAFRPVW